jgi:hypothetical protein
MRRLPGLALAATLTVLTLAPASLAGQSPGGLPFVLQVPASTRAMALGDAYMMNARAPDAVFYDPALLDGATGFRLDVQRWGAGARAASASAAMAWYGGGVAIGLQSLQYDLVPVVVPRSGGQQSGLAGQDVLFGDGTIQRSEGVASVGYGRRMLGVRVGLTGKLIEQDNASERDATGALDLGAATSLGPFTVGLAAQNLGPAMTFGGVDNPLPHRVTLGVGAYGRQLGPLDMGLSGAVTRQNGETIAAAGLELGYWPVIGRTFVARVGVHNVPEGSGSPFTFGVAYWGDDLILQTAYQRFGDLGEGTWRFSVGWK